MKKKLDNIFLELIPNIIENKFIDIIYGNKLNIKQDFVFPDDPTQLRGGKGKKGEKMPGGCKFVVIHDTGMAQPIYDGINLNKYIHKQANSKTGRVASWHFSVGEDSIYQHVPTSEAAWHAGDGGQPFGSTYYNKVYKSNCIGGGNKNGIGIETCINAGSDYLVTLSKCAKLTANLLNDNNLGLNDIKRHIDFSGKECPNIILNTTGLWEWFLRNVNINLKLLELGKEFNLKWEFDHNLISCGGKVNEVYKDTKCLIKLIVNIEGENFVYKYEPIIKAASLERRKRLAGIDIYNLLANSNITKDEIIKFIQEKYELFFNKSEIEKMSFK